MNTVVLDTNILLESYTLKSSFLDVLLVYVKGHGICISIPKAVIDETVLHFRRNLDNQATAALGTWRKVHANTPDFPLNEAWKESECLRFRERLDKFIDSHEVDIIEYPEVSHESILKRATLRKMPFSAKKDDRGYKDYLIFLSIIKLAKSRTYSDIHFITLNKSDFAIDAKESGAIEWHPDYMDDLKDEGLRQRGIKIWCDKNVFIDSVLNPIYVDSDSRKKLAIGAGAEIPSKPLSLIQELLDERVPGQELSAEVGFDDFSQEFNGMIQCIESIGHIEVESAVEDGNEIRLHCYCILNVDVEITDYSDYYGYMGTHELSREAEIYFLAAFDKGLNELIEFEISSIS